MEKESGTLSHKLCRSILHYRSSPHVTTGISPSELSLSRQLRTRLFLLKPDVEESVREKQVKQLKEPAIARTVTVLTRRYCLGSRLQVSIKQMDGGRYRLCFRSNNLPSSSRELFLETTH